MQKFIFFLTTTIFISSVYFLNTSYSDSSKYSEEIQKCIDENKNGNPLSIEEFVCISSKNNEEIAYQVVLDKMFKETDEEVEDYLFQLEEDKDYCFGKNSSLSYVDCINDIFSKFGELGEYHEKYKKLCDSKILEETLKFLSGRTSVNIGKDFVGLGDKKLCNSLAKTKLSINKKVAINILKLNKDQIRKDERKIYVQKERTKYDNLLDLVMFNLNYIERIWKKVASFTRNPY